MVAEVRFVFSFLPLLHFHFTKNHQRFIMNNTIKFFTLGLLLALLSPACIIDADGDLFDCERGEGPTITRVLNLADFHSFKLDISADVFISQGSEQFVEVRGEDNIISLLERDVSNGTWDIDFEDCVRNHDELEIYITLPEFRHIEIDGSGDIFGQTVLVGNDIELEIDGSGDMDLGLDMKLVDLEIDGSGDMDLEGLTDDLNIRIDGSGDVMAFDLDALRANIRINGSGNVEVLVQDFLQVDIDGSGDVYYKGNPELDVRIDGSGDVIDAN